MTDTPYYRFDHKATAGTTVFMIEGDKIATLDEAVFPPVGTLVSIPGDSLATVRGLRLDVSNQSGLAMIYIDVEPVTTGPTSYVPFSAR